MILAAIALTLYVAAVLDRGREKERTMTATAADLAAIGTDNDLERAMPDACPVCGRNPALEAGPCHAATHPYRSPASARNDRCLDCGEYEEDGPHAATKEGNAR